jgi:hypothetical protein
MPALVRENENPALECADVGQVLAIAILLSVTERFLLEPPVVNKLPRQITFGLTFEKIDQRQFESEVVEVVGSVNSDRSVSEMRSTDFGNDMDLKMYNEMLLLANGGVRAIF